MILARPCVGVGCPPGVVRAATAAFVGQADKTFSDGQRVADGVLKKINVNRSFI